MHRRQVFALTIGDPTGIGPEITAKLLQDASLLEQFQLEIIGHIDHLRQVAAQLGLVLPSDAVASLQYTHIAGNPADAADGGRIAYESLEAANTSLLAGRADAMVTGPISKANLQAAGIGFHGHTEILEMFARRDYPGANHQADMMFLYRRFRLLLLTRHVPLAQVGQALTVEGVCRSLRSLTHFLREILHIETPRLRMLGVNPHAGETGGREEETILLPAIRRIEAELGLTIPEPGPADAIFRGFNPDAPADDAYVAAYHDQGLIPMKLVAGLQAVNVTIGLPFLRTSVSHGMAPDIVGRGIASPASLEAALHCAAELVRIRG
jgi:4-hydroxythreonine-4-phosphate dehydrogenase